MVSSYKSLSGRIFGVKANLHPAALSQPSEQSKAGFRVLVDEPITGTIEIIVII